MPEGYWGRFSDRRKLGYVPSTSREAEKNSRQSALFGAIVRPSFFGKSTPSPCQKYSQTFDRRLPCSSHPCF
jgi:hypothetical protein